MYRTKEERRICVHTLNTRIYLCEGCKDFWLNLCICLVFAVCRCKNVYLCVWGGGLSHVTSLRICLGCVGLLLMSPHFFPTFSCLLVLRDFVHPHCTVFLFSRRHLSSIHLSPPPLPPVAQPPLWIIQACGASVFLVVVTSAVTRTHVCTHTHSHTHTYRHAALPACAAHNTQIHTNEAADRTRKSTRLCETAETHDLQRVILTGISHYHCAPPYLCSAIPAVNNNVSLFLCLTCLTELHRVAL